MCVPRRIPDVEAVPLYIDESDGEEEDVEIIDASDYDSLSGDESISSDGTLTLREAFGSMRMEETHSESEEEELNQSCKKLKMDHKPSNKEGEDDDDIGGIGISI